MNVNRMRVGLGMGSNLGDRLGYLRRARAEVLALPGVSDGGWRCAPLYETDPVDCPPGSGAFLNTVLEVEAADTLIPAELLAGLRGIEAGLGRPSRYPRHAPRPVDLDILYAGALVLHTPALTLPHPRVSQRRFVLAPLAAIRPGIVLPGFEKSVDQLLRESDDPAKVRIIADAW